MRIIRTIGGVVSVGLGAFLMLPLLAALMGQVFVAVHKETAMSVEVAGATLVGWQLWGFVFPLAAMGILLGIGGIYALRFRNPVNTLAGLAGSAGRAEGTGSNAHIPQQANSFLSPKQAEYTLHPHEQHDSGHNQ